MLETLQHMAKLDRTDLAGTGDDKGQLNYFIIMIGECFSRLSHYLTSRWLNIHL
jgi:hypothetical protein